MGEAPQPKSPPRYPDLCGRRRLQLEVQILNREVGFLECQRVCQCKDRSNDTSKQKETWILQLLPVDQQKNNKQRELLDELVDENRGRWDA